MLEPSGADPHPRPENLSATRATTIFSSKWLGFSRLAAMKHSCALLLWTKAGAAGRRQRSTWSWTPPLTPPRLPNMITGHFNKIDFPAQGCTILCSSHAVSAMLLCRRQAWRTRDAQPLSDPKPTQRNALTPRTLLSKEADLLPVSTLIFLLGKT